MRGTMIIPLWREGIVILLFAEWWKGRNKIQSPDSTVEKLFLSLFFSCMYILLLFSLLSLSLFLHLLFLLAHFLQQRCATLRFRKRSQISCRFLFAGISNFPPSPRCLIWKLNPPMVISFGAIYIGFARVETPLSVHSSSPASFVATL